MSSLHLDGSVAEALRIATQVAIAAAAKIERERPENVQVEATKSTATDVVTAMDRAIEAFLRDELAHLCPEDGILGEEMNDTAGRSGRTWVLDPIDGTVNYLYGIDNYSVSVGLLSGDPRTPGAWQPVAGAVASAALGRVYIGAPGLGAWSLPWQTQWQDLAPRLQGAGPGEWSVHVRALHRAQTPQLHQALVATGFGYAAQRRAGQARVLAQLLPAVRDIRRMGSAALDMCAVADGQVDAYYERGVQIWDVAAATAICQAAGVDVIGLRGAPASPEMTVVAPGSLATQLTALLAECNADSDPDTDPAIDSERDP